MIHVIAGLVASNVICFMYLCFACSDTRYWKSEAERYQEMWDRATWKKKPTTHEEQRP